MRRVFFESFVLSSALGANAAPVTGTDSSCLPVVDLGYVCHASTQLITRIIRTLADFMITGIASSSLLQHYDASLYIPKHSIRPASRWRPSIPSPSAPKDQPHCCPNRLRVAILPSGYSRLAGRRI